MNTPFTPFRLTALLLPAVLVGAAPQPQAPEPPQPPAAAEDETYQGEAPERYAMVRALEGEVRIQKGELEEALTRGTPIAEGDVVESRGRGVLQLGDGTRVAFAGATRFTVAALFTDRKGEKQVLLTLDYGRLRVFLGGNHQARFRVDTPSGSATCTDKGSFTVEAERDRTVRLKVHTGRVGFANERGEARIAAGERLTLFSPQDGMDRVRSFNTFDGDDFDRWSERMGVVKRGESWDRVPSEIRYYADDLDAHGRWIDSGEYGWVWQPSGVAEDWRPYYQGRWAPYSGGMTWVSDEPWAYVAYHHGRWHWGAGVGWFWIPGVYYSPAWVAWQSTPGYYGWAPLGYHNTPCHWGYGAWGGGFAWNIVAIASINLFNIHTRIHTDAHVIRTFNVMPAGGRDLHAPWQRTPLLVSRAEFHNPAQIHTAFRREVNRERLVAYERHAQATTGREIIRRELRPPVAPEPRAGTLNGGPVRVPFEDRRARPTERFTPRDRPAETRPVDPVRPADRGRELTPERKVEPRPLDRTPEPRPRSEERRPEPVSPRERVAEPRPRPEERRPDPGPRERTPEAQPERKVEAPILRERPIEARPERKPEAPPVPRERPIEARPERKAEAPAPRERPSEPRPRVEREERRPEVQARPAERESRPAPKAEAPREKPHEEKKREEKKG